MSVTVIIVNWNSGVLLGRCLHSLKAQTVQPEHVILVDNASTDNSASFAEVIANVTIQRMKNNLGFAVANNRAYAECDTDFVALLNPDAFPDPDWLEQLLEAAKLHPDVAAFGSRQLCQGNPEILDGIGDGYHVSGYVWRKRHGDRLKKKDLIPQEIFSPCAAASLYRRKLLIDVGGFDEDYFCYVEDVDLGFRLRLAGHKVLYVSDAVVHHVGSASTGGQHSDFSIYHGHRNLVWTYVKDMPGALFWLFLPLHILLNLVSVVWFISRGKGRVILRSKRDAIKGLPRIWAKRRNIQAMRVASIWDIWQVLDKKLLPFM